MGVHVRVHGVLDRDEKFNKMRDVYNACKKADIEIPDEVGEYFNYADPNELMGHEINIGQLVVKGQEYSDDVTYDVSNLPAYIKYIRVRLSD